MVGSGAGDSLSVSLPAGANTNNLFYYDGAAWKPVVALTGTPAALGFVTPDAGAYSFTLNNTNTQPLLSDLSGTPFSGSVAEVRITPSTTSVSAGETFQVFVDASSGALFGADVSMAFSAATLEVTSISLGTGLQPETIAVNTYDNGGGTLQFAYSQQGSSEANVSGSNLTLATITFLAHTAGSANVTLGSVLFTDRDGNPTTPAPLDSPINITVDPSPSVYVDVELQGRSDHAGLQLEVKPTGAGNVLYDTSVAAGRLEILNVPAGAYQARVSAPKYLAAIQDFTVPTTLSEYDLNAVNGTPASGLILGLRGGDINGDDQINIQDLVLIGVNFGSTTVLTPDINGDGIVNIQDLAIAAGNFGLKTGVVDFPDYPNDLWN
ncbi:MAG: cohesin domain-containing protein [Caldilineaceae bacterium]